MEIDSQDAPAPRTKQQIEQEYFSNCVQFGDKSYKVKRFQIEMDSIQVKMRSLDEEMMALEARIKAEKAEQAPKLVSAV